VLPAPRDGWEPVRTAIKQLHGLPGGSAIRAKAATAFISPMTRWALPLMEPAPAGLAKALWQAIMATGCTWWCQGRFWMENVQLHPVLGGSLQALQAAAKQCDYAASRTLQAATLRHAKEIGLVVRAWSSSWGLIVEVPVDGDARVQAAASVAAKAERPAFVQEFGPRAFRPAAAAGAHAARIAARVVASYAVQETRNDSEGVDDIDFEVQSQRRWVEWRKALSEEQQRQLSTWRQGAAWTPTRRWRDGACKWCGADWASARHFWADCPHLSPQRNRIGAIARLPASWWALQPRVTSKSGWATGAAAGTLAGRVLGQIAACEMALVVAEATLELKPDPSRTAAAAAAAEFDG
jgi:hypothetical protein